MWGVEPHVSRINCLWSLIHQRASGFIADASASVGPHQQLLFNIHQSVLVFQDHSQPCLSCNFFPNALHSAVVPLWIPAQGHGATTPPSPVPVDNLQTPELLQDTPQPPDWKPYPCDIPRPHREAGPAFPVPPGPSKLLLTRNPKATANAKVSIGWGTNIVGGVTPGRTGEHLGLPVLPTVRSVRRVPFRSGSAQRLTMSRQWNN